MSTKRVGFSQGRFRLLLLCLCQLFFVKLIVSRQFLETLEDSDTAGIFGWSYCTVTVTDIYMPKFFQHGRHDFMRKPSVEICTGLGKFICSWLRGNLRSKEHSSKL